MSQTKPKIIIPSNLLKIKYHRLMPAKVEDNSTSQLKLFQNPNAEYVLSINPTAPGSKTYDRVTSVGGMWNYLNVLGDFTINVENIDDLHISFPPNERNYYYLSDYSGADVFNCKKLTINSKNSVSLHSYSYSKEATCPIEELNLNVRSASINLGDLHDLKKLKLNTTNPNMYNFRLESMPKLETLDISSITEIFANNFRLSDVSNKCKLILNPSLKIKFYSRSIIDTCDLKSMVSWGDMQREDNDREAIPIASILGLKDQPTKPIEIQLIDFKENLMEYSNLLVADRFIKEKHNQRRAVETMRRRMNMTPEQIAKEIMNK